MQLGTKELDAKKIRAKNSRSVMKSSRKTKLSDAPSSEGYHFDDMLQGKTANILIKENNYPDREPFPKLHLDPIWKLKPEFRGEDSKGGTPDNHDIVGNSPFEPASTANGFYGNESSMRLPGLADSQASSPARIQQ